MSSILTSLAKSVHSGWQVFHRLHGCMASTIGDQNLIFVHPQLQEWKESIRFPCDESSSLLSCTQSLISRFRCVDCRFSTTQPPVVGFPPQRRFAPDIGVSGTVERRGEILAMQHPKSKCRFLPSITQKDACNPRTGGASSSVDLSHQMK